MLAGVHDETKRQALLLAIADAEAENANSRN